MVRAHRLTAAALLAAALATGCGASDGDSSSAAPPPANGSPGPPGPGARAAARVPARDWPRFGFSSSRRNVGPGRTGITARTVGSLRRRILRLDGTVDSSPVFVHGVRIGARRRDAFVVTSSYGRTVALEARTGRRLWGWVPPGIGSWEGSARITHTSPALDPGRRVVYVGVPDGQIHALALGSGRELRRGGWPARVTRDPTHEKLASALNVTSRFVIATTGGYIGDEPPYQGHVAVLDRRGGRLLNVFNALCSGRGGLIDPPSCPESGSAIWARAGAVVEPDTGRILVATGDGAWDGRRYWGDSVLELSADGAQLLQSWTPTDQAELDANDTDLGSTAPAVLPRVRGSRTPRLAVQGGKDGKLRLLDLARLNGRTRGAGPVKGGELQTVVAPGGSDVFHAPVVWRDHGRTWVFVATGSGTAAWELRGRSTPRLVSRWANGSPGTSPVLAGGLLYVYDPDGGRLNVYRPRSRRAIAALPAQSGHWSSPVVGAGCVLLPEGTANDHTTRGTLSLYCTSGG